MGTNEKFERSWGCVRERKNREMGVKGGLMVVIRWRGGGWWVDGGEKVVGFWCFWVEVCGVCEKKWRRWAYGVGEK
jgi:hypothetical protein